MIKFYQFSAILTLLFVLSFQSSLATAPIITNYDPIKDATGVVVNHTLNLTFDQNILFADNGPTYTIRIRLVSDNTIFNNKTYTIDGVYTDTDLTITNNVLSIAHANFVNGTSYYIRIQSGALTNAALEPFEGIDNSVGNNWRFTCVVAPPTISTYNPTVGATNISTTATTSLTFNKNINFGTNQTVSVKRYSDDSVFESYTLVAGVNANLNITGSTLTITHSALAYNTQYYVTIDDGAIGSTDGGVFGGISDKATWNFTTVPQPLIVTYNPTQNATGVVTNASMALTFNQNIAFATGAFALTIRRVSDDSQFQTYPINGGSTDANLSISTNQLTIAHTNFEYNTQYYITIDANALENGFGNGFGGIDNSGGNNWRFTTIYAPLAITTYDPLKDAVDEPLNKTLTLTFDGTLAKGTGGNVQIVRNSGLSAVEGGYYVGTGFTSPQITLSGNQLIINPTVDLSDGELYYVIIDNTALTNLSGTAFGGIDNSGGNNWRFTTIAAIPNITTLNPLNNATGVSRTATTSITFDKNIAFGTNQTVSIKRYGDDSFVESHTLIGGVNDSLSITGPTLTITHSTLDYNTQYYITIESGAIESTTGGVFAGISDKTIWNFTTVPLPTVTTYNPIKDATIVSTSSALSLTFDQNIAFASGSYALNIYKIDDSLFQTYVINGGSTDANLTIVNNVLTIAHTAFENTTQYYVIIDADAITNTFGDTYAGIDNSVGSNWRFTTQMPAPTISTYDPLKDATAVVTTKTLTLTFDQTIAKGIGVGGTIEIVRSSDSFVHGSYLVGTNFTSSEITIVGNQLIINPLTDFDEGTLYYVTISNTAIVNSEGTAFDGIDNSGGNNWLFTTFAANPTITFYNPLQAAAGVSTTASLSAKFNRGIKLPATAKNISIYRYSDDALIQSYTADAGSPDPNLSITDSTLTFTHTLWAYGVQYYILFDAGAIESLAGGIFAGIAAKATWNFTTVPLPAITTYNPLQNALNVAIDAPLSLIFNQNIDFATGAYALAIKRVSDNSVYQSYTINGGSTDANLTILTNTLSIAHIDLEYDVHYYITIDANAIENGFGDGFAGIDNSGGNNWRFTTPATPPLITTYSPLQDAVNVGRTDVLSLTFDLDIVFSPTLHILRIRRSSDGSIFQEFSIEGVLTNSDLTISTNTLSIVHNEFAIGTQYYVTIGAGAIESTAGGLFAGISTSTQWTFTSGDGTPPVAIFSPTNGTTEVSIYANIVVTYDEAIRNLDGSTIDDTNVASLITLMEGINAVPFTATIDATKTIITISPAPTLPSSKTIDATIGLIENIYGDEQLVQPTMSFTTDVFLVWKGTNSTTWIDVLNWVGDAFGGGYSYSIPVGTPFSPTVFSTLNNANNIILEPGAQLTINSGASINVKKLLELQSSNVDVVGNASLLNNGTITYTDGGFSKVHQRIADVARGYHISPMASGATINNTGLIGSIYLYNSNTKAWIAQGPTDTWVVSKGYVGSGANDSEIIYTGAINNASSYAINGIRTTIPDNYGWNLVGNPYPCAIDWDDGTLQASFSDMNNAFYIWQNVNRNYGTYNGNAALGTNMTDLAPESNIPSGQAFWVQVTLGQTSGSFTIPSSARLHNSFTYLKAAKISTKPVIRMVGISGTLTDETAIAFVDPASDLFDKYDSEKFFSSSNSLFELYTLASNKQLTINTFANHADPIIIPLGYKAQKPGIFQIQLKSANNFPEGTEIKLEDTLKGTITPITAGTSVDVTLTAAQNNSTRFKLHLIPGITTNTKTPIANSSVLVYYDKETIYIDANSLTEPKYELVDINGKLIKSGILSTTKENQIHFNKKGLIIVRVISKEGIYNQKILIN